LPASAAGPIPTAARRRATHRSSPQQPRGPPPTNPDRAQSGSCNSMWPTGSPSEPRDQVDPVPGLLIETPPREGPRPIRERGREDVQRARRRRANLEPGRPSSPSWRGHHRRAYRIFPMACVPLVSVSAPWPP
jgi:hypothetical protein